MERVEYTDREVRMEGHSVLGPNRVMQVKTEVWLSRSSTGRNLQVCCAHCQVAMREQARGWGWVSRRVAGACTSAAASRMSTATDVLVHVCVVRCEHGCRWQAAWREVVKDWNRLSVHRKRTD